MKNLTEKEYWNDRQSGMPIRDIQDCKIENEWVFSIKDHLIFTPNEELPKFLEIGCNPGYSTLAILSQFEGIVSGVDFNQHDKTFIDNIIYNKKILGNVFNSDIRKFKSSADFDLVFSCGFVEHFEDFEEIIKLHANHVHSAGYVLIVIPNFRYLQWLYHRLFDNTDLRMHNLDSMNVDKLSAPLIGLGFDILASGYSGRLRFWNYDRSGSKLKYLTIRIFSYLVRSMGAKLGRLLSSDSRFYSPWIYVLAKRNRQNSR